VATAARLGLEWPCNCLTPPLDTTTFEADAMPPKEIFRLPDGDPEAAEQAAEPVECNVSSKSVSMM